MLALTIQCAGIFGAATANIAIFVVQSVPAILALVFTQFGYKGSPLTSFRQFRTNLNRLSVWYSRFRRVVVASPPSMGDPDRIRSLARIHGDGGVRRTAGARPESCSQIWANDFRFIVDRTRAGLMRIYFRLDNH